MFTGYMEEDLVTNLKKEKSDTKKYEQIEKEPEAYSLDTETVRYRTHIEFMMNDLTQKEQPQI